MKRLSYMLLVGMLTGGGTYVPCEAASILPDKDVHIAETTEDTEEDSKDIHITQDEFDEIVEQLQGMKSLLEKMKQDYDARFKEMQDKIVTLEREKKELEKEKVALTGNTLTAESPETSSPKEETAMPLHTETTETTPLPYQALSPPAESMMPSAGTAMNQPAIQETGQWSPAQPLNLWSTGKSFMNISFDALFAAAGSTARDLEEIETGGHDPNQRGFTVQNLETVFDGAVDPYFSGKSVIVFQIDKEGESFLEVEEAYLTSMSLPLNLQVKAGTFFTEFGRLNPFHPHAWDFADQPLVNGRFLGPDGMRNPGARISWLAPTDNYTELFFTVQDSQGERAFSFRNTTRDEFFGHETLETDVRNMGDLLYVPHIATSFDLTEEQTILLGASAAFGPNSTGPDENTLIYGFDMFWKWKSKYASGGFPFVTWQTEIMARRFEAGADVNTNLPEEVIHNWGTYSQIAWGFKKRWVTALRGDYVDGEKEATDPLGFERWRLSPNITFYPSEFSKIRLQYNYDDIRGNNSTEHSVFVQFEFLLGAHAAHKF